MTGGAGGGVMIDVTGAGVDTTVDTIKVGFVCIVWVSVTGGGVSMIVLGTAGLVTTTGGGVTMIGGTELSTEEQLRGTCGWPSPI